MSFPDDLFLFLRSEDKKKIMTANGRDLAASKLDRAVDIFCKSSHPKVNLRTRRYVVNGGGSPTKSNLTKPKPAVARDDLSSWESEIDATPQTADCSSLDWIKQRKQDNDDIETMGLSLDW